jgi:hypothetical protein
MTDPIQFKADYTGVSRDRYVQWREFAQDRDRECPAPTKKGLPCKGGVEPVDDPGEFRPGYSEYCRTHREQIAAGNPPKIGMITVT